MRLIWQKLNVWSQVKSAESYRKWWDFLLYENSSEVRGVTDRSGVYKISMVRMFFRTDEPPNVRVYTAKISNGICKLKFTWVAKSKNGRYEIRSSNYGEEKLTGSKGGI